MGTGQKFLTRVRSEHLWFGKFPLKIPKFSIFSCQKNFIGRGQKVLGQRLRVKNMFGPSLTLGPLSGPIPRLIKLHKTYISAGVFAPTLETMMGEF